MSSTILIALLLFVSSLVNAQPLWISGSQDTDHPGTYNNSLGKLNVIGARAQMACWGGTAQHSNIVFGGIGLGNSTADMEGELQIGPLNDLWAFSSALEEWTYLSGSPSPLAPGQYPDPMNPQAVLHPGSRKGAAYWQGNGLLWVFGGLGVPSAAEGGEAEEGTLNDMWSYNATSKAWQYRGGSNMTDVPPTYHTDPITLAPPHPGSRECSATWVVHNPTTGVDTMWLFGGMTAEEVTHNDLWEYNMQSNVWKYHNITNGATPSARSCSASWVGPNSGLYIFGGQEMDPMFETITLLNDIWQFNTSSMQWTRISNATANGTYDYTTNARPSPRFGAAYTTDSLGNLWLFGGNTPLMEEAADTMNDLWTYNTTGRYWTWKLGSSLPNQPGVYNATTRLGTPAARGYACMWIDTANRLYMFGGANSTEEDFGYRNDLWKLYDIIIPKPPTTTTTGSHNTTTTSQSLTTGGVATTSSHATLTTGPAVATTGVSITTGAHNTTSSLTTGSHSTASSLTTGSHNTSTTGGGSLTTGGFPGSTTGAHNVTTAASNTHGTTAASSTHGTTATITTGHATSGNSTTHKPVSPAVISGTIMGGSVAITLGVAGVFLYRRRQRQRDALEDNELLPLNNKNRVN